MAAPNNADGEYRRVGVGCDGEDDDGSALGGGEDQQMRGDAGQELPWGAGADQEPHDQAEIVAGDVHEVAFVQVVAATQP